jgi:hypothetical protein
MAQIHFKEIIGYKKLSSCSVCDSHEYTLPFPITKEIEQYLVPMGPLKFPLDKVALVKIENDQVEVNGRVGRSVIRVKFKKNPELRELFEIQLGLYIGNVMQDTEILF